MSTKESRVQASDQDLAAENLNDQDAHPMSWRKGRLRFQGWVFWTSSLLGLLVGVFAGLLVWLFPDGALAQSLSLDLGGDEGGPLTARMFQVIAIITILSLAPGLLIMVTSFTRLVIVFSLLRTAMGTQGTPPNSVLVSLALFLTFFIMQPALQTAYDDAVRPLLQDEITEDVALERGVEPFRFFMITHVRESDLSLFIDMANIAEEIESPDDVPFRVLVPAFMISELRRAFEIGFLLFLPFLVIDMAVASILMSMGMMLLPPVLISLPFKLVFFVLIDGWNVLAGSLVASYVGG